MKVAALTRFKQGDLYLILKKLGISQKELSERAGISRTALGLIMNLRRPPTIRLAEKIQATLAKAGENVNVMKLFPEAFIGFKKAPIVEQIQEITPKQLKYYERHQELMLEDAAPPVPDAVFQDKELLEFALSCLSDRERDVIESTVIRGEPCSVMAAKWPVGQQRINQIKNRALNKIRYLFEQSDKHPEFDFATLKNLYERA